MGLVLLRRNTILKSSFAVSPCSLVTSLLRRKSKINAPSPPKGAVKLTHLFFCVVVSKIGLAPNWRSSFRRNPISPRSFFVSLYHRTTCSFRRKLAWERSRRSHDTILDHLEPNRPEIAAIVHGENLDPQDQVQMLSRFGKRCINRPFELNRVAKEVRHG